MWLLYALAMYLFVLAIKVSAFWSLKSRQWIDGRKNWKERLRAIPKKTSPRIWFHVSSLGEFEQAKPVMESIRHERPDIELVLTFFSPSGYLPRKTFPHASVLYLPADLPGYARYFIKCVQPDMAVFTKYDLWPGYLRALADQRIPSFLISAHWNPARRFSSWSLPLTRPLLRSFKKIFLQQKVDLAVFKKLGFDNLEVTGDTRIDRSLTLKDETDKIPWQIKGHAFDIIAGSTWPADENILLPVIEELGYRAIIAPHDVGKDHIIKLVAQIKVPFQLLSELGDNPFTARVLVVDSIGLLSVLYAQGRLAYVGGGFGKGIHNVLEPAAHAKPVLFGPNYERFPEAIGLLDLNAAYTVINAESFKALLESILLPGKSEKVGQKARQYLVDNAGATGKVVKSILESIPYPIKS